ncbi:MAG: ABC transporter ATP-binding protein [Blastocatellia bacterium]|jgi:phospholipid/cholesterol/gamma-HCH transport system ATP-binding protein
MGNLHNAIEFQEVSLAFGDRVILDRVSFTVRQGEAKVVMGGSGTGKSTLLRLALGLLKPDAGRILIDGEDVTHYSEEEMMSVRRKIGMVFQEGALFDSLSVYDNVAYRLREQQIPEEEIGSVVLRMLRFVDLEDSAGKMPNELSGGMRRRVGIARALVGNPKIIFYDEPTAGLDPITARTICELALKLRDLEEVSSIFVTHRIQDIEVLAREYVVRDDQGNLLFEQEGERLCLINTRFLMLKDGKIIFSGTDEEIRESSNPYIQKFFT